MQLSIPNPAIQANAIVTETMEKVNPKTQSLPLVFDIDVSKNVIYDPLTDDLWKTMDDLRNFKNQIFLNSITSKAKELFK